MKSQSGMSSFVFLNLSLVVVLGALMVVGGLVSSSSAQVITLEPGQKGPNFDIHRDRNIAPQSRIHR